MSSLCWLPLLALLLTVDWCDSTLFDASSATRNLTASPIVMVETSKHAGFRKSLPACAVGCVMTGDVGAWTRGSADVWVERIPGSRTKYPGKKCHEHQLRALVSMESDANYPLIRPQAAKHAGFDLTSSTRADSDVPLTYATGRVDYLAAPLPFANKTRGGRAMAAAFISNCKPQERLDVMRMLRKHGVTVDSYGSCHHSKDIPGDARNTRSRAAKLQLQRQYLFTLSFENSRARDYVTEKLFDALAVGSVPIYLGADNVGDFAPTENVDESIVRVSEFESVADLAQSIRRLARDEAAYGRLLSWKGAPIRAGLRRVLELNTPSGSNCRLCIAASRRIGGN